jgi:hypothetical protein
VNFNHGVDELLAARNRIECGFDSLELFVR